MVLKRSTKKCPLSISLIHFARILNRKARLCQEIAQRVFTRVSTDNQRYSKASSATASTSSTIPSSPTSSSLPKKYPSYQMEYRQQRPLWRLPCNWWTPEELTLWKCQIMVVKICQVSSFIGWGELRHIIHSFQKRILSIEGRDGWI